MQKLIIEHIPNCELENAIATDITMKLGDGWLDKMVVKMEDGVEIAYSLLDDQENQIIVDIHKSYQVDVFSSENCEPFIRSIYVEGTLDEFLEQFPDFDTDAFRANLLNYIDTDTILDKLSKGGLEALSKREINILGRA